MRIKMRRVFRVLKIASHNVPGVIENRPSGTRTGPLSNSESQSAGSTCSAQMYRPSFAKALLENALKMQNLVRARHPQKRPRLSRAVMPSSKSSSRTHCSCDQFWWNLQLKRRESDLATVKVFHNLYGEFFAVWKLWNYYVRDIGPDAFADASHGLPLPKVAWRRYSLASRPNIGSVQLL